MNKPKLNLSGAFAFILAILMLLILVPINMIVSYKDQVYDMTPSGKYTLDPLTEKILDETSDREIEIYFLSSLMELKNVPRYLPLYHTLTTLDERENITLTCFDPNENADLTNSLNPTGILEVGIADIFVKCGNTIKQIPFIRCFQQDSNGILEYAGENLIAGGIQICTSGNLPTIYFLKGYGSKTLDGNYSSYRDMVMTDSYDIQELDLSQEDAVPSNASIIYIAAPERDITVSDREKLSEYIDNGGAVSMLLSPSDTEGRFDNIEYLLAKFEIGMDYNIVKENNPDWQLRDLDSEQNPAYFTVSYPTKSEDYTEDLTTDINYLIANGTYISGISNTRSFYELTSSSEMIEKASIIENLPTSMDSQEYTTVSEPMGGDDITAADASKKSGEPLTLGYYSYNKQTGAKLIVVGSDEVIDDTKHIPTFGTRRLIQFSNTWLYNSDIDIGIVNKTNSYDTMTFEDGDDASRTIKLFILIPVIFAVLGIAVWLKRRNA